MFSASIGQQLLCAGPLFDWYYNGNAEVTGADFPHIPGQCRVSACRMAGHRRRRDRPPVRPDQRLERPPAVGDAVFGVTHQPPADWPYPDAPFTFVTDGLRSAIAQAQAVAGDGDVSITPGNIASRPSRPD